MYRVNLVYQRRSGSIPYEDNLTAVARDGIGISPGRQEPYRCLASSARIFPTDNNFYFAFRHCGSWRYRYG
jgi:hypothetical protein